MPYNTSIKFHPIQSTLNFSFFVATAVILKCLSLKIMCTHVRQNFWKVSSNSDHFRVFFCGFHGNGSHFENSESSLHIYSQCWISIRNIIIYLETKFRPNRRIFVFWRSFWIQNGSHSKPKLSQYGAACLTPCKYPFPLKSFHF